MIVTQQGMGWNKCCRGIQSVPFSTSVYLFIQQVQLGGLVWEWPPLLCQRELDLEREQSYIK